MRILDAANQILPEGQKIHDNAHLIVTEPDASLRFKVTPKCPWNCSFCHKEGGWENLQTATWNDHLSRAFHQLHQTGYREVHFTGGEPTTNPHLPGIIRGLKDIGFGVRTTSILGVRRDIIQKIIDAGIDGFNISLHGDFSNVDAKSDYVPESIITDVAAMQTGVKGNQAKRQILNLVEGLDLLKKNGVDVKANTVVPSEADIPRMLKIHEYAKNNGLKLRFLGNLTPGEIQRSRQAIRLLIETIGAKFQSITHKKGTADMVVKFEENDGYQFGVKTIADVLLEPLCNSCELAQNGECTERFYGIRLECRSTAMDEKAELYARLCLHRGDPGTLLKFDELVSSPLFKEITARCL